jgi:hypothetical protein
MLFTPFLVVAQWQRISFGLSFCHQDVFNIPFGAWSNFGHKFRCFLYGMYQGRNFGTQFRPRSNFGLLCLEITMDVSLRVLMYYIDLAIDLTDVSRLRNGYRTDGVELSRLRFWQIPIFL